MGSFASAARTSPKLSERPVRGTAAVECTGVVKRFYHYEHRTTSVQELVTRALRLRKPHDRQSRFVLRGLDLRIERGEAIAFIGPNGSGKSTALRLIAGVYPPTEGVVVTHGRVIPVIELGAGFHPELTGAENVVLYAAMLGLQRAEIDRYYPEIVAFSELDDSMSMPMKY
jgi:ABC-2 type transport system ATP-binding protein